MVWQKLSQRLSQPRERATAPKLYVILREIVDKVQGGERDYGRLEQEAKTLWPMRASNPTISISPTA